VTVRYCIVPVVGDGTFGEVFAGVLAERTGSFSGSFYMAAAFAGVAIVLSGFLRKPQTA
jgi:hypothetical protein